MQTHTPTPRRLHTLALLIFIAISLFVYRNTSTAGFVTDWFGWEFRYRAGGWLDIIKSFGYKGLHPVLHFFNYTLYKCFGTSSSAWYILFASLHAVNAWLAGSLYLRLAPTRLAGLGAVGVALLVLLSPYAAEPVVWRVCLHYLMVLTFTLSAAHALLDYLEEKRMKSLILMHVFFVLSLFCLEWSLVIPGILGLLLVRHGLIHRTWQVKTWALVSGVQAGLIGTWFLMNKRFLGDWVGHYGAATHLTFEPIATLATMWKYFVKQLLFMRYWHHPIKEQVFNVLDRPTVAIGLTVTLIGLAAYSIWQLYKRNERHLMDVSITLGCFFIALLPVANLFFYYLDYNENDRYGYFALPFLWIGVMLCLVRLPLYLGRFLVAGAIITSIYCLNKTTRYWHEADQQYRSLVSDFHQYDSDEVLVLALPDNYHGIYMFRIIGGESGLKEAIDCYTGKPYTGRMSEAVMYNAQSATDAIKANAPDSTGLSYHISFVHDGSWWWWNGIGASDRENDWFAYTKKEWHSEVALKRKAPNTAVIYPVAGKWQRIE
jgi:hypothetical protein